MLYGDNVLVLVSAAVVVFFDVKTFRRCLCSYELLVIGHEKIKTIFFFPAAVYYTMSAGVCLLM